MLIGCLPSTACPTIDLSSISRVNSWKSILIESFSKRLTSGWYSAWLQPSSSTT